MPGTVGTHYPGGAPGWLMLQRKGDLFIGYYAPDVNGSPGEWTSLSHTIGGMTGDLNIGLAVTAHNDGTLGTAVFDNIGITALAPVIGTPLPSVTTPTGLSAQIAHPSVGQGGALVDILATLNRRPGDAGYYMSEVTTLPTAHLESHGQFAGGPLLAPSERAGDATTDDYAVKAAGYVNIPAPGNYQFLVRHDDRFNMNIGATPVADLGDWDGGSPQFFDADIAQAGWWPMEIFWAQGGGGLGVEVASWNASTGSWVLLGDTANGGLEVRQRPDGVPDPAALGGNSVGEPVYQGPITPAADGFRVQSASLVSGNVNDSINFYRDKIILNGDATAYNVGSIATHPYLDLRDPQDSREANFPDSEGPGGQPVPFPNDTPGADDNYVTRINGVINIPEAGTYSFTVGSDDGYYLRIGNALLGRYDAGRDHPGAGTRANYTYAYFPRAGLYPVELYTQEGGGGSNIEFAHSIGNNAPRGLIVSSTNAHDAGFSVNWSGIAYSVEPVARLSRVGNALFGATYSNVPALGMRIGSERWTLEDIVTGVQLLRTPEPGNPSNIVPGLRAEWFNDRSFSGTPAFDVVATEVNRADYVYPGTTWTGDHNDFGVRYTGQFYAPYDGTFAFQENVDDMARLWIDGQQLLNDGAWNVATQNAITLTEGWHDLRFETEEGGGGDYAYLSWDMGRGDGNFQILTATDDVSQILLQGTGPIGGPTTDSLLLTFPMGETHQLRLTTMIAGLNAVAEDTFTFVPEPGTYLLLLVGALGLLLWRRRSAK